MNIRQFSMAILISALPNLGLADPGLSLNKGDFKAAKQITKDGESILQVKLSKSGKAKLKKLNKNSINQKVQEAINKKE